MIHVNLMKLEEGSCLFLVIVVVSYQFQICELNLELDFFICFEFYFSVVWIGMESFLTFFEDWYETFFSVFDQTSDVFRVALSYSNYLY